MIPYFNLDNNSFSNSIVLNYKNDCTKFKHRRYTKIDNNDFLSTLLATLINNDSFEIINSLFTALNIIDLIVTLDTRYLDHKSSEIILRERNHCAWLLRIMR